jgi:glutamyl-tRNA reductase
MPKEIFVYGVSHHGTPLPIRECLAVGEDDVTADLERLRDGGSLREAAIISTCNRVELIGTTDDPRAVAERARTLFNERIAPERIDDTAYLHVGLDAVRHLFRVASGLDSMVLGEPQILGQVKQAAALAGRVGSMGNTLGRCFERTFRIAKRVRNETDIAAGNVSVSSIACELAEQIFGDLSLKRVLIVGAGKMSEVSARALAARGAMLRIVNRDPGRAKALAEACGGVARPLEALATELAEADVVICSTAKQGFVITYELMQGVAKMRRYRSLFLIDIAIPRDVDPRVGTLGDVFLYDLDDLQRVSRDNLEKRKQAAQTAEQMINAEVTAYQRWLATLDLTPTIVALRARVREQVAREVEKTRSRLGDLAARDAQQLEALSDAIVNQLLHAPMVELKRANDTEDGAKLMQAVQRLFRLQIPSQPPPAAEAPEGAELAKPKPGSS